MQSIKTKSAFLFSVLCSLLFVFCVRTPVGAANGGASLQFSPASGTFFLGSTFNVSFVLNTGGKPVNAIDVQVRYPADKIQVANPSIGTSFVSIWVMPPTYSNFDGTLSFRGGVPNPGIVTSDGIISTATFRARDVGEARIEYVATSQVLANDGKGTNILTSRSTATFTIVIPPPEGPEVYSPTHPDQNAWYRNADATFFWKKGDNVDGFSYDFSEDPFAVPDEVSEGVETSAVYKDIRDGIWYFHVRSRAGGIWGGVTHYLVRIDRTPPAAFQVVTHPDALLTPDVQPSLAFFTTDGASGMDRYEVRTVKLDGGRENEREASFFTQESSPYLFPMHERGTYQVVVRAYDRAGNARDATTALRLVEEAPPRFTREGFRIFGFFVRWWWLYLLLGILLILLLFAVWILQRQRRTRDEQLKKELSQAEARMLQEYHEMYQKVRSYRVPVPQIPHPSVEKNVPLEDPLPPPPPPEP